jgi:hypothetical protein
MLGSELFQREMARAARLRRIHGAFTTNGVLDTATTQIGAWATILS